MADAPSIVVTEVQGPKRVVMTRKTKIVATLGPASWDKIPEMIEAGVNVFRVNFSHCTDHSEPQRNMETIRNSATAARVHVAILGDLGGPKIRCGGFVDHKPIPLVPKAKVLLRYSSEPGSPGIITTNVAEVVRNLKVGEPVLLDDGTLRLAVSRRVSSDEIECEVIVGGTLKERKGINVPELEIPLSALTEKDKRDATFMLTQRVDYIALSFVQRAQDIVDLRTYLTAEQTRLGLKGPLPRIISKIEKPQALQNIESIMVETDGIMVARGDLGVEYSLERVPVAQKMLITLANKYGKPVITATQMLESMINSPVPTRAEVSDVANAVFDGTDAVMLSGEAAAGQYPLESVRMMGSICRNAEEDVEKRRKEKNHVIQMPECEKGFAGAIADAAVAAANEGEAEAIIVLSQGGNHAMRLAKRKPLHCIIAVTDGDAQSRALCLFYGVYPVSNENCPNEDTIDGYISTVENHIMHTIQLPMQTPVAYTAGDFGERYPGLSYSLRLGNFGSARLSDHVSPTRKTVTMPAWN